MEEIKIGNQIWTSFNLSVEQFANGELIQEASSYEDWKYCGLNQIPAYCSYENKQENEKVYGKLYNWFAVDDKRGLAPIGWQIPSLEDYIELLNFLEPEKDPIYSNFFTPYTSVGTKLKSINGWLDNNGVSGNGNNSSGFNGLPGGSRIASFWDMGRYANFWCSSSRDDEHAHDLVLYYQGSHVSIGLGANKECGFSVRCLKFESQIAMKPTNTNSV